MWLKKFKYKCDDEFFYFFGLKFCTNVEKKYEKEIFDLVFRKKSLDLQKIENHIPHFPIVFGLVTTL
jgi:hypothetical protein